MERCSVVRRFEKTNYDKYLLSGQIEAVQFKSDRYIQVFGIGMYIGTGESTVEAKLMKIDGDNEDTAREVATSNEEKINNRSKIISIYKFLFTRPVLILANEWHVITATISCGLFYYGVDGKGRVEADGVVFEYRDSKQSSYINVRRWQIPEIYFKISSDTDILMGIADANMELTRQEFRKLHEYLSENFEKTNNKGVEVNKEISAENEFIKQQNHALQEELTQQVRRNEDLRNENDEQHSKIQSMQSEIDKMNDCSMKLRESESVNKKLVEQIEQLRIETDTLREVLVQTKFGALLSVRCVMKFSKPEKLEKLYATIQLENGTFLYFDNNKPFELFTTIGENRIDIDLSLLRGEYDCAFRGTVGNHAYFSASQEKLNTEDLILFANEPVYFIEDGTQWSVYHNHENYEKSDGENFETSGIRSLRKYKFHYHRGILCFFRSSNTARLERLNDKVVVVEGPMLDGTLSFYTPPHSDCIYIASNKQNALLSLNTTNLNVSQELYEPPIETDYHAIVGIHEGILTMLFEGKAVGRCLMTTKLN